MGEILPDGSIQGYFTICRRCNYELKVNIQGQGICTHCGHYQDPVKEGDTKENKC